MGALTCEEIEAARSFLLRRVQRNVYQAEVDDLRAGKQIERNSSLIKLAPYLDHLGLLCVGGRIEKAPLPIDVRHPIILPRSERVTELILYMLHRQRAHLSAEQLHHEARGQYWIPKGRITAIRIHNQCYKCKKGKAKGRTPMMAALPAFRLKIGYPAFTHTGVDYFGPIRPFPPDYETLGRHLYLPFDSRCTHGNGIFYGHQLLHLGHGSLPKPSRCSGIVSF